MIVRKFFLRTSFCKYILLACNFFVQPIIYSENFSQHKVEVFLGEKVQKNSQWIGNQVVPQSIEILIDFDIFFLSRDNFGHSSRIMTISEFRSF